MTGRRRRNDDEPSSGIGDVLGAARRGMGVPIERAAADTHLRETYLAALERDDIDRLGLDPAYVRGTLRTYADYLALDSAALLARHRATAARGAGSATAFDGAALDDRPRSRPVLRAVAGVVGLVLIAVLAFVLGETLARQSILPFWEASGPAAVVRSGDGPAQYLVRRNRSAACFAEPGSAKFACDADDGRTVVE